jgi:hypothetical protein
MTPQTPLWYSTIGSVTGVCFQIGETILFAPCEDPTVYIVADATALTVTAHVPHLFARFVRETIVEKRLASLGGTP